MYQIEIAPTFERFTKIPSWRLRVYFRIDHSNKKLTFYSIEIEAELIRNLKNKFKLYHQTKFCIKI